MMDLHFYPMDVQNCTVEIESCKIVAFAAGNFAKTYLLSLILYVSCKAASRAIFDCGIIFHARGK